MIQANEFPQPTAAGSITGDDCLSEKQPFEHDVTNEAQKPYETMSTEAADDRRKHLEMIQAVVTRMAQNSFTIKGWSITLVSVLLAFQQKDSDRRFALLAFVAALGFAALDAYYLAVERSFRDLYSRVASGQENRPFVMEPGHRGNVASALVSIASIPHLVVIVLSLAVTLKGWAWWLGG